MGTGEILLGVTLRWTSIPSRGEQKRYEPLVGSTQTLPFYLQAMVILNHIQTGLFWIFSDGGGGGGGRGFCSASVNSIIFNQSQ